MPKRKRRAGQDEGHDEASEAFRNRADSETLSYLNEIKQHLATITDTEERELLINNAFEGLDDLDNIPVDATCTKILETLAPEASLAALLKLLGRLNQGDRFSEIASNPFGSHFLDALLKSLSMKDNLEDATQVLMGIVEYVGGYMGDFLADSYATHVLRRLLAVLCGRDVVELIKMKGGKGRQQAVPEVVFPELLKQLVEILQGDDYQGKAMDGFVSSSTSGATLQAMLYACAGNRELVEGLVWVIIGQGADGEIEEKSLRRKMFAKNASHLLEVIFRVSPDRVWMSLFSAMIEELLTMAMHPCANFVVQAMGKSASSKEQAGALLEHLGPSFHTLLQARRAQVVISVLEACLHCQSHMKEACKFLSEALQAQSNTNEGGKRSSIIDNLLFADNSVEHQETYKGQGGRNVSGFGCVILSTVLEYPPACNTAFLGGLVRLNAATLQELVMVPSGARVVETIIKGGYKSHIKQQLLEKMGNTWGKIVKTGVGCHVVWHCFDFADASMKENIAKDILKSEVEMAGIPAGHRLLKHMRISEFKKNKQGWLKNICKPRTFARNFLKEMEIDQGTDEAKTAGSKEDVGPGVAMEQREGENGDPEESSGTKKRKHKKSRKSAAIEKGDENERVHGKNEVEGGMEDDGGVVAKKKKRKKEKRSGGG